MIANVDQAATSVVPLGGASRAQQHFSIAMLSLNELAGLQVCVGRHRADTDGSRNVEPRQFLANNKVVPGAIYGAMTPPLILPLLAHGLCPVVLWRRPKSQGATKLVRQGIWDYISLLVKPQSEFDAPMSLTRTSNTAQRRIG